MKTMQNFLVKSVLGAICLTLVLLPVPAKAQKGQDTAAAAACSGVSVYTSSPQVTRGYNIGIVAMVVNCSSAKQRITVEIHSVSACGVESAIGYNRVALNPGQSIQVTVGYPIPTDACPGVYTVTATASSTKTTLSSSTTTFTVL
jgi:uncharacterized membrane protein